MFQLLIKKLYSKEKQKKELKLFEINVDKINNKEERKFILALYAYQEADFNLSKKLLFPLLKNNNYRLKTLLTLGFLHYEENAYTQAINAFKKYIEINPNELYVSIYICELLIKIEQRKEAHDYLLNILNSDFIDLKISASVVKYLFHLKDAQNAIKAITNPLIINNINEEEAIELLSPAIKAGAYKIADELFSLLYKDHFEKSVTFLLHYANLYKEKKRYSQAINLLEKALLKSEYSGINNDSHFKDCQSKSSLEIIKMPKRTEIINFLLSTKNEDTYYLEIGVRNPDDNYNHIISNHKYSVDPGIEYGENPVDFKMTSDNFFELLSTNKILSSDIQFDIIFIDGLHLAEQVNKDIINSMKFLKKDGFIVLHDCNPPTEWHARENYQYEHTPAGLLWNGTTWKAFLKWRFNPSVNSCCIDSDWGVGILSKKYPIGSCIEESNPFFEFNDLMKHRKEYLNLISFNRFKKLFL